MKSASEARDEALRNKEKLARKKVEDELATILKLVDDAVAIGRNYAILTVGVCPENVTKLRDAGYKFGKSGYGPYTIMWSE
jgi:hypothetical protein